MFNEFGLIMVVVSDMAASVAYYRDILELGLQFESPEWSQFRVGHVSLGLHLEGPHLKVSTQVGISFGFYVSSIDDTLEKLADKGVHPIHRSEEDFGTLAVIHDPDGYGIQICQTKFGA
jgi:catechol 2,3-dioxygenase-like lactoylglutathione lyase family enzyme